MEDEAIGGAFDVDRLAIVAALAPIGDQGVGLLLAVLESKQAAQGSFKLIEVLCQPGQLLLRFLFLLRGPREGAAPLRDIIALLIEIGPLLGDGLSELLRLRLLILEPAGSGSLFTENLRQLRFELLILLGQDIMQLLALLLPCFLVDRSEPGLMQMSLARLVHRLGPCGNLRPPIDDQQQQNQRPHGAEQHRQKGKRVDPDSLSPTFHNSRCRLAASLGERGRPCLLRLAVKRFVLCCLARPDIESIPCGARACGEQVNCRRQALDRLFECAAACKGV
jgi:hypothetical protein